jgi:hypothetical protein
LIALRTAREPFSSDRDELFLSFVLFRFETLGQTRGFQTLDQSAQLEREEAIGGCLPPQERQKGLGPDQDRFGLAVNRQNISCGRIFERIKDLGKVAVKLAAADKSDAGLRHSVLWAMIGQMLMEKIQGEQTGAAPACRDMTLLS